MYQITLLCVGNLKERFWRDAAAEYQKRLGAYCKLRIFEVGEYRLGQNPSPAQAAKGVEEEGKALLEKIPAGAKVVSLCIEGKEISSPRLAQWLEKQAVGGSGSFCLIIGGSDGLSETVKQKSALRLSMSPMTFPHQLARIMVLEQLYRAMNLLHGGKYHK